MKFYAILSQDAFSNHHVLQRLGFHVMDIVVTIEHTQMTLQIKILCN